MSKRLANILLGMFLFIVCANYYFAHSERWKVKFGLKDELPTKGAIVKSVLSGDTFVLTNGRHVHFVAMQAPRSYECMGHEATGALEELLKPGTRVELRRDSSWPSQDEKTLLRHVWLEDGRYLPTVLAEQGFLISYTLTGDSGDQISHNRQAVLVAKENKRGMWGTCNTQNVSAVKGARTQFKL